MRCLNAHFIASVKLGIGRDLFSMCKGVSVEKLLVNGRSVEKLHVNRRRAIGSFIARHFLKQS